jgi:CHAT domain-containing protein
VSYHLGPDFGIVVVITPKGSAWRLLRPDLRKRLARLGEQLDFQWGSIAMSAVRRSRMLREANTVSAVHAASERALREAADEVLREVHRLLWRPVEELASGQSLRWVVAPHGPIHRFPLAALLGRSGYLIETTDVCTVPSARVWGRLARPLSSERRNAWIAGVPSSLLPGVERELGRVEQALEGWSIQRDTQPTQAELRRLGPRSDLIHLAAHGSLRTDNPAFSFIELTDGPLFVHDLASLRLPGSAVVLTVCLSGRGTAPAGEEWIGLARGFLQAGASAVVASLWAIHEDPTLALVAGLYRNLVGGMDLPTALGSIMRARIPTGAHPWEWAPLHALGGVWMTGR